MGRFPASLRQLPVRRANLQNLDPTRRRAAAGVESFPASPRNPWTGRSTRARNRANSAFASRITRTEVQIAQPIRNSAIRRRFHFGTNCFFACREAIASLPRIAKNGHQKPGRDQSRSRPSANPAKRCGPVRDSALALEIPSFGLIECGYRVRFSFPHRSGCHELDVAQPTTGNKHGHQRRN